MNKLILYIARDNSGYVVYDTFSGETKYITSEEELEQLKSSKSKDNFTVYNQ